MMDEALNFLTILHQHIKRIDLSSWTATEERRCRGEEALRLKKGNREILIGYEPYGPPFCWVAENQQVIKRIDPPWKDDAGLALAKRRPGTPLDSCLLQEHENAVRQWLDEALPLITDQLK